MLSDALEDRVSSLNLRLDRVGKSSRGGHSRVIILIFPWRYLAMKKALLALGSLAVLTSVLSLDTSAQTPDQPAPEKPTTEKTPPADQQPVDPCPQLNIKAPNQPVRDGVPIKISATLAGGDKKIAPMFDWSISAGVINAGQGTPTIEVDTTGAGVDRSIYATVLIGGFSPECVSSGSASVTVAGPPQKSDKFGPLSEDELSQRVDNFLSTVSQTDRAYIFAYAGRTNVRGYASNSLRQIRAHALRSGMPSDRLVTIDGGFREEPEYELWVVPIGSEAPRPSPTVNAREIVYPRPTPPVRKRP